MDKRTLAKSLKEQYLRPMEDRGFPCTYENDYALWDFLADYILQNFYAKGVPTQKDHDLAVVHMELFGHLTVKSNGKEIDDIITEIKRLKARADNSCDKFPQCGGNLWLPTGYHDVDEYYLPDEPEKPKVPDKFSTDLAGFHGISFRKINELIDCVNYLMQEEKK